MPVAAWSASTEAENPASWVRSYRRRRTRSRDDAEDDVGSEMRMRQKRIDAVGAIFSLEEEEEQEWREEEETWKRKS